MVLRRVLASASLSSSTHFGLQTSGSLRGRPPFAAAKQVSTVRLEALGEEDSRLEKGKIQGASAFAAEPLQSSVFVYRRVSRRRKESRGKHKSEDTDAASESLPQIRPHKDDAERGVETEAPFAEKLGVFRKRRPSSQEPCRRQGLVSASLFASARVLCSEKRWLEFARTVEGASVRNRKSSSSRSPWGGRSSFRADALRCL